MATINIYTYDRKTAFKVPETVNLVIQAKQSETGEKDEKGNKVKAFHPNLTASVYFSAPVITSEDITDNIVGLLPFIKGMLNEAQKGIVKAQILEKGVKSIDSDAITVAQCVKFMTDTESGKITDDYIKGWFNDNYSEVARTWIINGFKWNDVELTDVMNAQIDAKLNTFRDILALCATAKVTEKKCIESRHYNAVLKFDNYLTTDEKSDSVYALILENCTKSKQYTDAADMAW